jgi:hypothetical protein
MPGVDRRSLLGWAAIGPLIPLVGCAPSRGANGSSPTPTSTPPTTSTTPRQELPEDVDGKPFGPDGTHWPNHTPKPGRARTTVEVDCRWDRIAEALAQVQPTESAAGLELVVKPGVLEGQTGRDVLAHLGSTEWSRNVLVTPRDGWGSVTMTGDTRLRAVHGVTFARFTADAVGLADCSRTALAQSKLNQGLRIYAEAGDVRDCSVYEAVVPAMKVEEKDPFAYAAAAGATLADSIWEGCYGAPVYRPMGSKAHLDTFQMFGAGFYRGLTLRDTVLFGAHNSALQLGGVHHQDPGRGTPFVTLDHSLLIAQTAADTSRYPAPEGAELPPRDQVINGAGEPGELHATRSVVIGTLYTTQWGKVSRSYTSNERVVEGNRARRGGWRYDPELNGPSAQFIDRLSPKCDDKYLASIWR